MMMRSYLERILDGKSLTAEEAEALLGLIMDGQGSPVQIGAMLCALRAKGEEVAEILGFARAMRKRAQSPNISSRPLVDTCGTGGDASGSFNFSTVAAFVLAGAGVSVVKHGNRAVSSQTGSADLLEALGIRIAWTPEEVGQSLLDTGFAFLFAPAYHPAMKAVAPIRKELGVKTVFNILGPLTNPCAPEYQLIGVYSLEKAAVLAEVLSRDQRRRVLLVHSEGGWDEATPAAPFHLFRIEGERVSREAFDPQDFGLSRCRPEELQGAAPSQNAGLALQLLQGERGPLRDALVLNAGLAFWACEKADSLSEGMGLAEEVLGSGKALRIVEKLRERFPLEHTA